MLKEFKDFISRGNVMDLAVGVIVGGAFSKIVTSIVNDILMPILGIILGGIDFTALKINIGDTSIMYGNFIQNVVDFLIVAFCIFVFIKMTNRLFHHKKEEAKEEVVTKSDEVVLLEEIRDLLKEDKKAVKKANKKS